MKIAPPVTEYRSSEPSRDREGAAAGLSRQTASPAIIFDGASAAVKAASPESHPTQGNPPSPTSESAIE